MVVASPSAVRPARAEDADAIGRIHVVSWQAAYADALPAAFLEGLAIADRQHTWRQRLAAKDRAVRDLVVIDGGVVAGFACVGASRDDDVAVGTGELWCLYLDPAKWGRGLGRQLHDQALATLRQDGYVRASLWVLDSNDRARHFYERAGWVVDGATKVDSISGSPPLTEVRYTLAF